MVIPANVVHVMLLTEDQEPELLQHSSAVASAAVFAPCPLSPFARSADAHANFCWAGCGQPVRLAFYHR